MARGRWDATGAEPGERSKVPCARQCRSASRLLAAPLVQRVVDLHLSLELLVVALAVDAAETHRDRLQSGRLRGEPDVGLHVSPVDDPGQALQRRVAQAV